MENIGVGDPLRGVSWNQFEEQQSNDHECLQGDSQQGLVVSSCHGEQTRPHDRPAHMYLGEHV